MVHTERMALQNTCRLSLCKVVAMPAGANPYFQGAPAAGLLPWSYGRLPATNSYHPAYECAHALQLEPRLLTFKNWAVHMYTGSFPNASRIQSRLCPGDLVRAEEGRI